MTNECFMWKWNTDTSLHLESLPVFWRENLQSQNVSFSLSLSLSLSHLKFIYLRFTLFYILFYYFILPYKQKKQCSTFINKLGRGRNKFSSSFFSKKPEFGTRISCWEFLKHWEREREREREKERKEKKWNSSWKISQENKIKIPFPVSPISVSDNSFQCFSCICSGERKTFFGAEPVLTETKNSEHYKLKDFSLSLSLSLSDPNYMKA